MQYRLEQLHIAMRETSELLCVVDVGQSIVDIRSMSLELVFRRLAP
jgi:hypothetical protein